MNESISLVYQKYIWNSEYSELAQRFFDNPPETMGAVVNRIPDLIAKYQATDWFDDEHFRRIGSLVRKANASISALTAEVLENINRLENGGIEAAHQSVAAGGPCYILNKAATASIIASIAQNEGYDIAPFFFLADYDIVQSELTNIRTPIMGKDGNLVSVPVPEGYEYSPVSVIPLPRYRDWYTQVEDSIRESYRPIFKVLEGHVRVIFEERLEYALTLIRWAYTNSATLSEWSMHILGRIMNVDGQLGIPLVPASSMRDLVVRGMEFLLSRNSRETFLAVRGEITSAIESNGFVPGIGTRTKDFVPFYYECPEETCHRSRIELHCDEAGSRLKLKGRCPSCAQTIEFETSSENPDLSDLKDNLSPRVDTRQMIIDMVLPVLTHVGGSGETAYYAQVIPIANALSIPFPTFVKYPRVYFNTPWNENLAATLSEKDIPVLHRPEMFKITGKVNRFRRKNRPDDMNAALFEFERYLHTTHSEINQALAEILDKMESPEVKKDDDLAMTRLEVERYLSWVYGQYADEKMGQESSWSWIEWVLNSGLVDIFGPYKRAYVKDQKNGATVFVNFVI